MLGDKLVLHNVDYKLALGEDINCYGRSTLTHSLSERFARLGHHHFADDEHRAFHPLHGFDLFENVANGSRCSLLLVHEKDHASFASSILDGKVKGFSARKVEARFEVVEVAVPDERVIERR
jgi:hypothetical protein